MKERSDLMKKMSYLLVAVLSVFVLCACGNGVESKELELDFSKYFGMTMDEYLEATNTSKNAVKEDFSSDGLWEFKEKTIYKETEFVKFLEVDLTENIIIGGRYIAAIENPDESTFELVNAIMKDIVEKYGEPTTYAEPEDRLSNMKNFADIAANTGVEETWTIVRAKPITIPEYEDTKLTEQVELLISCLDGKATIEIRHKLYVDLNAK